MARECGAFDCENDRETYSRYCSNVCMNVQLEVAAEAAFHMDGLVAPEDVPDDRIAEIRNKNQQAHDRINAKIESQT